MDIEKNNLQTAKFLMWACRLLTLKEIVAVCIFFSDFVKSGELVDLLFTGIFLGLLFLFGYLANMFEITVEKLKEDTQ